MSKMKDYMLRICDIAKDTLVPMFCEEFNVLCIEFSFKPNPFTIKVPNIKTHNKKTPLIQNVPFTLIKAVTLLLNYGLVIGQNVKAVSIRKGADYMDEVVKEFKFNGITVRIHGGQPDKKILNEALQTFGKALVRQGIDIQISS